MQYRGACSVVEYAVWLIKQRDKKSPLIAEWASEMTPTGVEPVLPP